MYSSSKDCSAPQEEYSVKIGCLYVALANAVIHKNEKPVATDAAVADRVLFFHRVVVEHKKGVVSTLVLQGPM
jgi:hypothetical protein